MIFLAHSMGGLLARYYLETLEGWRDTKALFTFGTPYRGSLMTLNFLANGYKNPFVGTQQPTLQSVQLVNGQVTASRDLPIEIDPLLINGDGTVPYLSAVPIELSDDFRETYLPEQHGSLQNHPKVLTELRDRIAAAQAMRLWSKCAKTDESSIKPSTWL